MNVLQLGVFVFVIASAPHSPLSHASPVNKNSSASILQISPGKQSALPKHEHEAALALVFMSPSVSKHCANLLQNENESALLLVLLVLVVVALPH